MTYDIFAVQFNDDRASLLLAQITFDLDCTELPRRCVVDLDQIAFDLFKIEFRRCDDKPFVALVRPNVLRFQIWIFDAANLSLRIGKEAWRHTKGPAEKRGLAFAELRLCPSVLPHHRRKDSLGVILRLLVICRTQAELSNLRSEGSLVHPQGHWHSHWPPVYHREPAALSHLLIPWLSVVELQILTQK